MTVKGLRQFTQGAFAGLFMLAGAALVIGSVGNSFSLRWLEHPEATERLLWIEHTWRMVLLTLSFFGGFALAMLGWSLLPGKR